jgi:hypothetical protein
MFHMGAHPNYACKEHDWNPTASQVAITHSDLLQAELSDPLFGLSSGAVAQL